MGCLQSLFDIPPETYNTTEINPHGIKVEGSEIDIITRFGI